jgi:O-antigen/teichoic acid export membrane protein
MTSNTTRIVKNTLMLYFRQILIMLVSLYTVRVVLNTLGVEDYGIYNVVGGITVLFSFLNGAMTSATQRFLNYALGQNNIEQVRDVYSISLVLYSFIALFVIVFAETLGLWFLRTQLNIPSDRRLAAFWVYQFSIVAMVINIMRVPYYATIIAYEKMTFFAQISILEGILKLIIAFLLLVSPIDILIFYALLGCSAGFLLLFVYKYYCNKNFTIAHFRACKDKKLFFQLIGFSNWSILGGIANVSSAQGTNMLINMFSSVTVNAALGIAVQVNSAVYQFVGNFQTAFNPQIIKSYAMKDYDYFITLLLQTSKYSFYLLFLFVLPLFINIDFILSVWLNNVPEYAVVFTQLILVFSLIDAISGPLWMSVQATGNIKKYQLIVSCFIFANLPLSFLFLRLGYSPVWVLIIKVALNILTLLWRTFFLQSHINFPVLRFFIDLIVPVIVISLISSFVLVILHSRYKGFIGLIVSCLASLICTGSLIYFLGLKPEERRSLKHWLRSNKIKIND